MPLNEVKRGKVNEYQCGVMDEVGTSFKEFDFVYPIPDYSAIFATSIIAKN